MTPSSWRRHSCLPPRHSCQDLGRLNATARRRMNARLRLQLSDRGVNRPACINRKHPHACVAIAQRLDQRLNRGSDQHTLRRQLGARPSTSGNRKRPWTYALIEDCHAQTCTGAAGSHIATRGIQCARMQNFETNPTTNNSRSLYKLPALRVRPHHAGPRDSRPGSGNRSGAERLTRAMGGRNAGSGNYDGPHPDEYSGPAFARIRLP